MALLSGLWGRIGGSGDGNGIEDRSTGTAPAVVRRYEAEVCRCRARQFGVKLKGLLQQALRLWHDHKQGKAPEYAAEVERIVSGTDASLAVPGAPR